MRRSVLGPAAVALLAGCAHAGPVEGGHEANPGFANAIPESAAPAAKRAVLVPASTAPQPAATRTPLPDEGKSYEPAFAGGVIEGCPPGMVVRAATAGPVAESAPCAEPADLETAGDAYTPDWWGLAQIGGGQFLYRNGYLLRPDGAGRISGYVPLLGGALSPGEIWPQGYAPAALPRYYVSYFGLGQQASYRYANDVVYRVDPGNRAITGIAALLASDGFVIGQPVPTGYDIYNIPEAYRDRFPDGDDEWYRYSDGHIYTIDPQTRLVIAADSLMAS